VPNHSTLKTTPAVVAAIASEPWTVDELIERTACYNPPNMTAFDRYSDTRPDGEQAMRFIFRDFLWLTIVLALSIGWWVNSHNNKLLNAYKEEVEFLIARRISLDEAIGELIGELEANEGLRLHWNNGDFFLSHSKGWTPAARNHPERID
jgi:hypothetical protein